MDKKQIDWIRLGPYPVQMAIALDDRTHKRLLKEVGINDTAPYILESENACVHKYSREGDYRAIVCFNPKDIRKWSIGHAAAVAAHEAVHVWQFTRDTIGEREPASEQEAYFVDYVVRHIFDIITPHIRRRRK